jgi:hypothetical protein
MNARVDFAISPPGIFRGAQCHTLIVKDDELFILRVSRGWRVAFNPAGALNQMAVNAVVRRIRAKAEAATATVTNENYRELAANKGNAVLRLSELSDLDFRPDFLDLRFRAAGKKLRFNFEESEREAASAFVASLVPRAA